MSDNSASLLGKIAGYTEILAKDPQSTVFVSLCEAYRQLGMLDDALEIAQKGTRSLTGFSPGFVSLGRIHAQQGDLADAANAFEKALAIEKGSLPALKGLARARYRQGYLDKARDLLLQANQLAPQDPVVSKMLASLQPEAVVPVPQAEAVQEQAESSPEVAETIPGEGQTEEEGGGPADSSPIPTVTLADLYIKQELFSEAANVLREILRLDPTNEEVRSRLVVLKERLASADNASAEALQENTRNEAPSVISDAEPVIEPVSDPVVPEPVVQDDTSELDVYQRWLNAIEQRRGHVC